MRLGIDFGGTIVKAAIFDEDGSAVRERCIPTRELIFIDDPLKGLLEFAGDLAQDFDLSCGGLAIKGLVDTTDGRVLDDIGAARYLADRPLRRIFGERRGCPFAVDNDARAYAWGEWKFGAGRGSRVMVCMTLGTGLGCAVVKDGRPYEGATPLGGILGGHLSIDRNGPLCTCGQRGCLEGYCSATALESRVASAHPEFAALDGILPAFFDSVDQNPHYGETLRAFQDDLVVGIVNVIHAFGPDVIVLGGGVLASAHHFLPRVEECVKASAWTYPRGAFVLTCCELGSRAAILGAAFHPQNEAIPGNA